MATGKIGFEMRKERCDTLVEWSASRKYKIMNIIFQMKEGKRWTWKSPNGVTKTEIDNFLTNRPYIITAETVINQVKIGSDHSMAMNNIKLDKKTSDSYWETDWRHYRTSTSSMKPSRDPKKRVKSSQYNQQATEIEDIITDTSPDDETTSNGGV